MNDPVQTLRRQLAFLDAVSRLKSISENGGKERLITCDRTNLSAFINLTSLGPSTPRYILWTEVFLTEDDIEPVHPGWVRAASITIEPNGELLVECDQKLRCEQVNDAGADADALMVTSPDNIKTLVRHWMFDNNDDRLPAPLKFDIEGRELSSRPFPPYDYEPRDFPFTIRKRV